MTPPLRFETLVALHSAELFRYAYWLARDRHAAEDILQEALIRGWRAFPRLRESAAAKGWLYTIVRNEFLRKSGAGTPELESLEGVDIPDERAESGGFEMREALMALPPAYAEPLALQVLGGYSCGEIAAMLAITEGATMTRLTRARQALRRLVDPVGAKVPRAAGS